MGRDLLALVGLPWNLTMRVEPGVYEAFGFQIGCLYLLGAVACLAQSEARRNPIARMLLPFIAVLVLLWFFTIQEPRYLLPALALVAVVGGIGWDRLLTSAGRWKRLWLLLPPLPCFTSSCRSCCSSSYAYGCALGGLSVADFEGRAGPGGGAPASRPDETAGSSADGVRRSRLLLLQVSTTSASLAARIPGAAADSTPRGGALR
jgi:hypothetical protein